MSLLKMNENKNRAIIIVGKDGTDKLNKAMALVSDEPIVRYANVLLPHSLHPLFTACNT